MSEEDLDAVEREASRDWEAEGYIPSDHAGERFWWPRIERWPLKAMRAIDQGKYWLAFEVVLGVDDSERLLDTGIRLDEVDELLDTVMEAHGVDLGNSSRSADSSRSTPAPSNPTLPATTNSNSQTSSAAV